MKNTRARRVIDLLSEVEELKEREDVMREIGGKKNCITEYNALMEEYEKGGRPLKTLILPLGDYEPGVYQLLPLFCKHFGIGLFKTYVRVGGVLSPEKAGKPEKSGQPEQKAPLLIGIRK
ncbi:hypothetical protein NEDG_00654 [Nematocida displodere]|uniref:Uncharacterized protein n=1 Tax=Nematocida displodere TaxID=1805483 RepID=A0A177EDC3_9MICR|nr:hypothetical protein NEDG_00654 [Nematocida displodere]